MALLLYLLVGSCEVVPDFDWIVDDDVEITAGAEHLFNINQHVVQLGHAFERWQEALVGSLSFDLARSVLQSYNTSVHERNQIVPIERLIVHRVHVLGSDEASALIDEPVDAPLLSGANLLVLPAASPLLNDGRVVELAGHRVDQTDEALPVGALHRLPDVPDLVTRGPGHVPSINSWSIVEALINI